MKKVRGIILRAPKPSDLLELKAKVKLSQQHFAGYVSVNSEGVVEAPIGTYNNGHEVIQLITHKDNIVGYMSCCMDADFALRAEEYYNYNKGKDVKIGSLIYAIFDGYSRQGYMYSALQIFIKQLLYLYNYDRIFAMVEIENIASVALLRKLNFLELPDFTRQSTGHKLKLFATSKIVLNNIKKLELF